MTPRVLLTLRTAVFGLVFGLTSLLHVTAWAETRTVASDGSSEYTSIQTAILDSGHGDVVEVRPGVYRESLFYGGRRIRVVSTDGPQSTIIDATGLGSAAVFIFGEPRSAQLSGFTLRGGTGRNLERPVDAEEAQLTFGGAILCNSASPTLENLIFTGNQANTGGALYSADGSPFIDRCTFRFNFAGEGGAIAAQAANLVISECTFEDNDSVKGGAIYGRDAGLDCHRSTFRRNTAGDGGAVYMFDNPGRVTALHHCVFFRNRAEVGAAIRCLFGNLDFRYCVVSHNGRSDLEGVTEVHYTGSTGVVRNNVFSSLIDTEHLRCENSSDVSYFCNVFWPAPVPVVCEPGASNISVDPLFCQPKKGDFRYRVGSPLLAENAPPECGVVGPYREAECPTLSVVDQERYNPRDDREIDPPETEEERRERTERSQQHLKSHKVERYGGVPTVDPPR